jgi:hypothetical protein
MIERVGGLLRLSDERGPLFTCEGEHELGVVRWMEDRARGLAVLKAVEAPTGLFPPLTWRCDVKVCGLNGTTRALKSRGDLVYAGDRMWFHVMNTSPRGSPSLYVNLIEIGVTGALLIVNQSQPTGVELPWGRTHVVGRRRGAPEGIEVSWPRGVDGSRARAVTLLLIASTTPLDLRVMSKNVARPDDSTRSANSAGVEGCLRDPPPFRWDVRRFCYDLHPERQGA